ncbi:MAG: hypothetical protein JXA66_00450, partial [Oligoflexia bacterium]|nr:hypothetical protein [Oligoflexia bacterium]
AFFNPEFSKKVLDGEVKIRAGLLIKLSPLASFKVNDYFIRKKDRLNLAREDKLGSSGKKTGL